MPREETNLHGEMSQRKWSLTNDRSVKVSNEARREIWGHGEEWSSVEDKYT